MKKYWKDFFLGVVVAIVVFMLPVFFNSLSIYKSVVSENFPLLATLDDTVRSIIFNILLVYCVLVIYLFILNIKKKLGSPINKKSLILIFIVYTGGGVMGVLISMFYSFWSLASNL